MNKEIGQVYKVHTNKYFVKVCDNIIQCDARGLLKIKSDGILVGDFVEVEKNTIIKLLQRKNRFIRPNVSNVDTVIAVLSPEPKPDYFLIDKLCVNALKEDVEFVMVVNKSDIDDSLFNEIKAEYSEVGVKMFSVSSKNGDGIDKLKEYLTGKLSVFAGQSAVGKTSITNAMFSLQLKTGDLSQKIVRGKHTTTRSEIFECENIKIIDSPGFAVIDADVELNDLKTFYPEYLEVASLCKFRGCSHVSEPNCRVKEMVENGILSKKRYERYVQIYKEIQSRRISYEKD